MKSPPRSRRRAERTREKLLAAFIELALTRGYARLSPNDVAARAGVGRSTLYTPFGGLLELLEASLARPCAALAASVRTEPPSDALLQLLGHFRAQWGRNAAFFREPIYSLWSKCLARAIDAS